MKYERMAVAVLAVVAAACNDQPVSPDGSANAKPPASVGRIGTLHTEKDCTNYFGFAGDTCTITKSNLKEIGVGSVLHYLQAANSDHTVNIGVMLDEGGTNKAFGRCAVELVSGTGVCVFDGGTGSFRSFRATVDVTRVGGVIDAWDGTYSFGQ